MEDSPRQQIEFFEEEVKDILGKPPQYLIRWGISLYFILFCFVLFLSLTVEYPIYTRCEAEITPLNRAEFVVLNESDQIRKIKINDGDRITKGSILYNTSAKEEIATTSGELRFLKPITAGYSSTNTDTILQINPDLQNYLLTIKVPGSYINQIQINQKISFPVNSKIIEGSIQEIPTNPDKDGFYLVKAQSDENDTYLSSSNSTMVDILINNKKIFHKILNL